MITTPPPPEVHTPDAPLHGPLFDPPHISNRKSDRIANRQKRADRTPSPDCNAASFDSEGPGELKRTPKQRRQPTATSTSYLSSSTRASSHRSNNHKNNNTHISPPSSPLDSESSMMPRNRSSRAKAAAAHELGAPAGQLGLPTPARTPRKQVLLNNNSEAARVLFPSSLSQANEHKHHVAATPSRQQMDDAMFPTPVSKKRGKRTRKNVGFRLDNELALDADGRGGDIEIYTDSREQRPEVDESSENPFYVRPGEPKKKYPKRKVKPQQAKKVEAGLEMLKNDRGYLAVGRGRRFWKDISDPDKLPESPTFKPEDGDDSCDAELTSDQLNEGVEAEATETATETHKLRPRRLFADELGPSDSGEDLDLDEQVSEQDEAEAATDIEDLEKQQQQHANDATASNLRSVPKQQHHRHTGKRSADISVSPFDSWPRRKPSRSRSSGGDTKVATTSDVTTTATVTATAAHAVAAAAPAKREGEPLVPASASKRMRESHH